MTIRRAILLLFCVFFLSSGVLAGQSAGGGVAAPAEGEMLKWGITQGGLTLVCVLLILSEIRRSGALAGALEKATTALATHAETDRVQAAAFERLARSVEQCEAVREMVRSREREG